MIQKIKIILFLSVSQIVFSQYYTGQRVFANKFPSEVSDLNQDTYIQINNSNTDIIVAVRDLKSDRVIQHAYIKAEQTYKFKNIPVGTYVCNYMWTDSRGKRHFNKDNSTMPFKPNEVGGYVITMEKTVSGNLTQSSISEDDFFN